MDIFDDGPYETGDENLMNPDLVPAPANSYLGKTLSYHLCRATLDRPLTIRASSHWSFPARLLS